MSKRRLIRDTESLLLGGMTLATLLAFVNSTHHWWPEPRQALFLAGALLTIAWASVWVTRLRAIKGLDVFVFFGTVIGSTLLLEW